MKNRLIAFLLAFSLLLGLTTSVSAQTYSFELPREVVHVYWNSDGTSAIDYRFTFKNSLSADAIDFVDVGLPNGNYDVSSITADVEGSPVEVTSDYQGEGDYGVAVSLGEKSIAPGETGTVHVYIPRLGQVLYPDDNDEAYASAVFFPTWFGSQYVSGTTDLTVTFHLPPGVQPEEPRYHQASGAAAPIPALDANGRVTYTWRNPQANGYTPYTFGASFPAKYVPEDAIVRVTFWDILIGGIAIVVEAVAAVFPFCMFAVLFFGLPIYATINERKRKLQYISPKIAIEGHGIKRGLTAVEAAILLETPLDKVMTMILFGVIKKGAAQVISREPLKLQALNPSPAPELRAYEKQFLEAVLDETSTRRKLLKNMTVALVRSVTEKMKGFSRKETVAYYQSINQKAWQQIEAADTPEVKSQMYEEALEWTMLDKDYDDRSRRVLSGPIFAPTWWGRYDPVYVGRTGGSLPSLGGGTPPSGGGGQVSLPGADMAASIMLGTQSFAQKVMGGVENFTGGITNVTNPVPVSTSSGRSGGGGGGGGCACACACAGCACACAGGGR